MPSLQSAARMLVLALLMPLTAATAQQAVASGPQDSANIDPQRLEAARQLFTVMNMDQVLENATENQFDVMVRSNPTLGPFRDVFIAWSRKYLTGPEIEEPLLREYAKAFTAGELHDMTAFYKSPSGQKALQLLPTLMLKGAQFGEEVANRHQPELMQMLQARKAELERQNAPADSTHH